MEIDELDAVVFYDKPFLKFERLLETYYAFSPKGLRSFIKAMPVWLNEKMFLPKNQNVAAGGGERSDLHYYPCDMAADKPIE